MNILTEIKEASATAHTNTGKPATTIYLGRNQMERLMRIFLRFGGLNDTRTKN